MTQKNRFQLMPNPKGHWVALKFSPSNIFVETVDCDYISVVDNKVLLYFVA